MSSTGVPWETRLENHAQFPDRTNVVFVRVEDRRTIELRIWERGVGETTASGTCSCAAAVASMINDKADRSGQCAYAGWTGENSLARRRRGCDYRHAEVIYAGEWLAPDALGPSKRDGFAQGDFKFRRLLPSCIGHGTLR